MKSRTIQSLLTSSLFTLSQFAVAGPSLAARAEWSGGRLSVVEGETFFQAVEGVDWSTAEINLLVETGDRFLTGDDGRVEIQLAGNDILRLWHDTELELVDLDDSVEIWAWSGSLYLRSPSRYDDNCGIKVTTPEATVCTSGQTLLRVDIEDDDHTVVYVLKGEAEIFTGDNRLRLTTAERATTTGGEISGPTRVDPRPWDAFMRWCRDRDISISTSDSARYLPMDAAASCDLDLYGNWVYVPAIRVHVWRPVVSVGWSPYVHGRWIFSVQNGWVWISYEPWGWLPYHYGCWSWYSAYGWVWVPGGVWSGAWVDWAVCGNYIGWRPILYQVNHIHISVPPGRHCYHYVHSESITHPNRRIIHLEESYIERHKVIQVASPDHIVKTGASLRNGPEKATVNPIGRRVTVKSNLAGRPVTARSEPALSATAKVAVEPKPINRGNTSFTKSKVARSAKDSTTMGKKDVSRPSPAIRTTMDRPVRSTATPQRSPDLRSASFNRPAQPAKATSASSGSRGVPSKRAVTKPVSRHHDMPTVAQTRTPAPTIRSAPSKPSFSAPKPVSSRPSARSSSQPSQRRTSQTVSSFSGSSRNALSANGKAASPNRVTFRKKRN